MIRIPVVGDHEQTMDQLHAVAARHGWRCDVRREGRDWRAEFTRVSGKS